MSTSGSIFLCFLFAFNFGETFHFSENAPEDLVLDVEISPDTPVLNEPFYVRVTITNVGEKDIEVVNSLRPLILFGGEESGYLLDLLSPSLKENRIHHDSYSASIPEAGYALTPQLYLRPLFTSNVSMLSPGKSRILLLDRIELTTSGKISPEGWNKLAQEEETQIRFSLFVPNRTDTISRIQPIRFLPEPDTVELKKLENEIVDKKLESFRSQKNSDIAKQEFNEAAILANPFRSPMACLLLPLDEGFAMIDKYPPGTIKAIFYLSLLRKKYLETEESLDEIIRWFWTLPEIERQALSILMLIGKNNELIELRKSRKFLSVLVKNFPAGYDVIYNGDPVEVFTNFADCANMSESEVKSAVASILKSPVPQYAGKGNLQRGFFLAPRKWSFSQEELQLISYFETNIVLQAQNGDIKIFPTDKLSKTEQIYLRLLATFPQTGQYPCSEFLLRCGCCPCPDSLADVENADSEAENGRN